METGPRTQNQQVLADFEGRFRQRTRFGGDLLRFLRINDVSIYRYDPDEAGRWWLHLVLPKPTAEMFDTRLEVVCLYTEYESVEPRLLSLLQERLRSDARVEPEFAVVISRDPELRRLAARRRGEFAVLTLEATELAAPGPRNLRARMAEVMTTLDHYDVTFPISEPSGFFGRRRQVDELRFALDRGQPVGIFGLRKAGKTSLLNFVQQQREQAGKPVVRIDLSETSTADAFRMEVLKRAYAQLAKLGRTARLKLLTREGEYRASLDSIDLYWLHDLTAILDGLGGRLEVFIDEIDQAYPDRSSLGVQDARDILVALTQMRGLIQRRDAGGNNSLVLLCAGVDPALFERPIVDGRDNLLYKLVRLDFLAPMDREEMAEMVRSLGKRMGLRYRDHRVIDFLYEQYGGHPLLTRKACSWSVRQRPADEVPWDVPLEAIVKATEKRGRDTPSDQAADVLASFTEWFPDEAELLRLLWSESSGDRDLAKELLRDDPEAGQHIPAYGLAFDDWSPRIRALKPFLT